ncbi:hypothetical protein [Streptomyces sp. ADI95-17]|uniref:hypothetical protein n=1 Tax=Streptomyces sp. ADI95-17 TaxID=1522759 RepID=UPI000F5C1C91|nr:hypothetical protein [Streptomyces sp. ADI95-17]RPK74494.1 hypothetical protein EES42_08490 [Streptomyces sp. ADI95-17]
MSADLAPYVGAATVIGAAAVTWAARLASTARTTEAAVFTEPEPGVRYLRCDTPRCAHMTRPHRPQADGTWVCSNCGDEKGGSL